MDYTRIFDSDASEQEVGALFTADINEVEYSKAIDSAVGHLWTGPDRSVVSIGRVFCRGVSLFEEIMDSKEDAEDIDTVPDSSRHSYSVIASPKTSSETKFAPPKIPENPVGTIDDEDGEDITNLLSFQRRPSSAPELFDAVSIPDAVDLGEAQGSMPILESEISQDPETDLVFSVQTPELELSDEQRNAAVSRIAEVLTIWFARISRNAKKQGKDAFSVIFGPPGSGKAPSDTHLHALLEHTKTFIEQAIELNDLERASALRKLIILLHEILHSLFVALTLGAGAANSNEAAVVKSLLFCFFQILRPTFTLIFSSCLTFTREGSFDSLNTRLVSQLAAIFNYYYELSPDILRHSLRHSSFLKWITGNTLSTGGYLSIDTTITVTSFSEVTLDPVDPFLYEVDLYEHRKRLKYVKSGSDSEVAVRSPSYLAITFQIFQLLRNKAFTKEFISQNGDEIALFDIWLCVSLYVHHYQYRSGINSFGARVSLLLMLKLTSPKTDSIECLRSRKINENKWKLCHHKHPVIPLDENSAEKDAQNEEGVKYLIEEIFSVFELLLSPVFDKVIEKSPDFFSLGYHPAKSVNFDLLYILLQQHESLEALFGKFIVIKTNFKRIERAFAGFKEKLASVKTEVHPSDVTRILNELSLFVDEGSASTTISIEANNYAETFKYLDKYRDYEDFARQRELVDAFVSVLETDWVGERNKRK
ncbi:hypothetical protein HF325_001548 [Metschnikowia pulcherrima]|uniref:Uncharacterized protein n=1 Tax=Metschnikowia pulcherrima TaxID=27326 RepID=A0A8H7GUR2_9ASCO|nr:hypothetical protein HF325_001548 [Metschnikowia pulcherrima]